MPATTPRSKSASNPPKPTNGDWDRKLAPRFVRCELNAEQKVLLAAWALEQEDVDLLRWIDDRIQSGHVLSVRSNEVGYQASLTGDREASGHAGVSLVARASTPLRALMSCRYKDELVLQGVWPAMGRLDDLDY